jgi:nitrous oxide reductase accessory protein NosL
MKKSGLSVLTMVLYLFLLTVSVQAQEDLQKHSSCKYCGMDRKQFAHTRMLIEYDDASTVGTCSIHCAAIDLALHIEKTPKAVRVGDYNEKTLIDAEKAFWVIGGNKMGVMTRRAKWAFDKKEVAEKFIKENGGENATFDVAMKTAYEDMYTDTKMIRERRKMKKMEQKK